MAYCGSDTCTQPAIAHGYFCTLCFQAEWGPDPSSWTPLPFCLMDLVFGFVGDFSLSECANLECFQFVSCFCTHTFAANVLYAELKKCVSNNQLVTYIAHRYCRSEMFWNALVACCRHCTWDFLLMRFFKVANIFAQFHPIQLSWKIMDHAFWQSTDDFLWYVVTTKTETSWFEVLSGGKGDADMIESIQRWESDRMFQHLIDFGYFSDKNKHEFGLKKFAKSKRWMDFFIRLWTVHFSDVFIAECHDKLLHIALKERNAVLLEFLISLDNARVPPTHINLLLDTLTDNSEIRHVVIRNKHIVTKEWVTEKYIENFVGIFILYDANVLPFLNVHTFTNMLLAHDILRILCWRKSNDFWLALRRMTHLGTKEEVRLLVQAILKKKSIADIHAMVEYPAMRNSLTFAVLRDVNIAFVHALVAKQPPIAHLQWLATWRDCENKTLTLADVYAKNKMLLRFAHETNNNPLRDWILQFELKHRRQTLQEN